MAFTPRTSKTSPSNLTWQGSITNANKWWYDENYNGGANARLCLPNCTTYAKGRTSEISGSAKAFLSGRGTTGFPNANNWYGASLWERGQTPKLGAIACFQTRNASIGGHLAIVESTDGTLAGTTVSYSGYVEGTGTRSFTNPGESSSLYFTYSTYNQMIERYRGFGSDYELTLQGFIYNPDVDPGPGPTPGPDPELSISPSRYEVTMESDQDYVDFPFNINMFNIPLDEDASGGNTYPGLDRVYNTGWQYVVTSESTRNASKQQTLRYNRESNKRYDVTKYMYYDKSFSTGRVTATTPMIIHVKAKGVPLFLTGDGSEVSIR